MAKPLLRLEARKLRIEKRMTIKEIALKIGVSSGCVFRWTKDLPLSKEERKEKRQKFIDLGVWKRKRGEKPQRIILNKLLDSIGRDVLVDCVKKSVSIRGVMLKLKINSWRRTRSLIKFVGLDTSHFLGRLHGKLAVGKMSSRWVPATTILIDRTGTTKPRRQAGEKLRRALIEVGVPHTCSKCSIGVEWMGEKLVLEVNHKNGNWLNDTRENLEFLCPNCHSQSPTYRNRSREFWEPYHKQYPNTRLKTEASVPGAP